MSGPAAVTRHPVAAEIVSAFGLEGRPRALVAVAGAWSNRMYRLETSAAAYAVKQMLNPWDDPVWRRWIAEAWEFELAACSAGFAMPRPVPAADGACLADVGTGDAGGTVPVRVHAWVDADPCPAGPVDSSVAERLGAQLARLHRLRHLPRRDDVFPQITRAGVDDWPALVGRLREVDPGIAEQAAAVSTWIGVIADLFDAAPTDFRGQAMSHGDIEQKNILLTVSGAMLCDWDVAAPWDPRAELARTAMSLASWERPDVARAAVSGYRSAAGPEVDAGSLEPEDLAADLVIGLNWIAFCLERATGLRPTDQRGRRQSRELATGLLTALPGQVRTALDIRAWMGSQ